MFTYISDVVTATEIEGFDVGQSVNDVTQTPAQGQDLHAADPSADETGEERRIGAAQVQLGLAMAPHGAVIGGLAPLGAHLRRSALIAHFQQPEDDGQDLRIEARDVRRIHLTRGLPPLAAGRRRFVFVDDC